MNKLIEEEFFRYEFQAGWDDKIDSVGTQKRRYHIHISLYELSS